MGERYYCPITGLNHIMTDELTIMAELGEDTELLLAPDEWLENQRVALQQKLSLIADELNGVLTAQRIKGQLQQRNMVAVRCVEKCDGQPRDIIIQVCPVPDAIARLERERKDPTIPADVSDENARQQLETWRADGYDIEASRRLRRRNKDT